MESVENSCSSRYPTLTPPPDFSFRSVPLTKEEMRDDRKKNCLKFATPDYPAYVLKGLRRYIRPEHIYSLHDTNKMKSMKAILWCARELTPEEHCLTVTNQPEWYTLIEMKYDLIDQWVRDHEHTLGAKVVRAHQSKREQLLQTLRRGVEVTRDFSSFPHRVLDVTDEDERAGYIRFQTPSYVARVPIAFQRYISPQHLFDPRESSAM